MSAPGKRYLGDAVYVEFDGYMLKLTTEDGIELDSGHTSGRSWTIDKHEEDDD